MKDTELRGLVLREFYEQRRNGNIGIGVRNVPPLCIPGLDREEVLRISAQLGEHGLLDWNGIDDNSGHWMAGVGKISAYGVDVMEGERPAPLAIHVDQSQHIHIEGQNSGVQIAGANSEQQQSLQQDIEKLINAIDGANVSETEKKEAKGILSALLQSKAVAAVLGSAAGGLLKHCGWV